MDKGEQNSPSWPFPGVLGPISRLLGESRPRAESSWTWVAPSAQTPAPHDVQPLSGSKCGAMGLGQGQLRRDHPGLVCLQFQAEAISAEGWGACGRLHM